MKAFRKLKGGSSKKNREFSKLKTKTKEEKHSNSTKVEILSKFMIN